MDLGVIGVWRVLVEPTVRRCCVVGNLSQEAERASDKVGAVGNGKGGRSLVQAETRIILEKNGEKHLEKMT